MQDGEGGNLFQKILLVGREKRGQGPAQAGPQGSMVTKAPVAGLAFATPESCPDSEALQLCSHRQTFILPPVGSY